MKNSTQNVLLDYSCCKFKMLQQLKKILAFKNMHDYQYNYRLGNPKAAAHGTFSAGHCKVLIII